ncbi:MAG: phosphoribosylaminoimidazolesuccinocarboxamide synthase [Haloferacaceae archaeon]
MFSVKDLVVEREATPSELGEARFRFTDDYSVFDWGKMPDRIPNKGASLCTMGAFNFVLLELNEAPTHFRGVVTEGDDEPRPLAQAERPPREMAVEYTRVPELPATDDGYDYDAYHEVADRGSHFLVPLEIIFRNSVPVGSSLRDRVDPRDVNVDREEWPDEAVDLPGAVIEFSTKFEEQDRYLSREEADRIAGRADIERLETLARAVNHVLTQRAESAGFAHEDGKIECLYHDGAIKVADVAGTFDENRYARDGQEMSKEVVRQYYKREHPEWVEAVSAAKAEARERGIADWKSLCDAEPPALPDHVVDAVSDMYAAGTNAYTDDRWFDAPPVDEAVEAIRDL